MHTGQPINPQLFDIAKINPQTKNLLILGGSQGARGIDQALIVSAAALAEQGIRVFHQCRKESLESLEAGYQEAGVEAEVVNFIDDMPAAYAWSNLVLTRSGLNTVAELEVVGRPGILVPLVGAPEQLENAENFVESYVGVLLEEDMLGEKLVASITQLLNLSEAPSAANQSINSAAQIAEIALNIS